MAACTSEKFSVDYAMICRIELILSRNFYPSYLLEEKLNKVNQLHSIRIV